MVIKVISRGIKKQINFSEKTNLLTLLQEHGYKVMASCGGNGTCGKCKVKVISGIENSDGYVLACQTYIDRDCEVEVFEKKGNGLNTFFENSFDFEKLNGYNIIMDLGTTTIAYNLINQNGKIIDKYSCLNPQQTFGADVISRIKYATENGGKLIQQVVIDNINETVKNFKINNNLNELENLYVAGNTTMINLLLGEDVSKMGVAPFRANVLESVVVCGEKLLNNNLIKSVITMPSNSCYVGGDVIVGATYVNIEKGNNILVDIGTNGEIVLHIDNKLYCASTAAGPCFEGAKIECGMGGYSGAINHVGVKEGKVYYTTIDDEKPLGICGAGLIDAVAIMLDKGIIDFTGAFEEGERFNISENVYITSKDIREFQLAKSAIRSGIDVLAELAGLDYDKVDNLYIAGGLGFYINMENAVRTGLLPPELKDKIRVVGNTAVSGAYMCALNKEAFEKSRRIAKETENIELSESGKFSEKFMENMIFEVD